MEVATTWYFAFRDGHKPICRFLRRGFGHVCAWTMLDGRAILINPTTSVVEVRSYSMPDGSAVDGDLMADIWVNDFGYSAVVRLSIPIISTNFVGFFGGIIPSCVNAVKAVSSYRSFAQTPYGLFCALVKSGGKVFSNGRFV